MVRSTTQRYTPRPLPWGVRRLANSGSIPRSRIFLPLLFVIEASVAHRMIRALAGVARLAGDGGHGIQQRHGLVEVRPVRGQGVDHQGDAFPVGEDRVFAPGFRAIDGAGTRFLAAADSADMGRICEEPLEVD